MGQNSLRNTGLDALPGKLILKDKSGRNKNDF